MNIEIDFQSMSELVAFALITEKHAHDRYSQDAEHMQALGNDHLADVFQRLAEEERKHAAVLEEYAEQDGLTLDLDVAAERFAVLLAAPKTDNEPRQDDELPSLLSPYGILARAVRNEERAFEFYCQVAAHASSASLRTCAEALAHEELAHAALFRAERRNAYREENGATQVALPAADELSGTDDLLALAIALETRVVDRVPEAPAELVRANRRVIDELTLEYGRLGSTRTSTATPDTDGDGTDAPTLDTVGSSHAKPDTDNEDYRDELDRLFTVYEHIARTSQVEAIAQRAQVLMASALDRIRLST